MCVLGASVELVRSARNQADRRIVLPLVAFVGVRLNGYLFICFNFSKHNEYLWGPYFCFNNPTKCGLDQEK